MTTSPTVIGTNTVTALSRHIVLPVIVDQIYGSNALFFRWNNANKKRYTGGLHVEVPLQYAEFNAGGAFSGLDVLDTTPQDTIKNAAFGIKGYYVPVTIPEQSLVDCNTPMAAANLVTTQVEQGRTQMADNLGTDLYSDGSDTEKIDGLKGAVDDGGVLAAYGGITRSSNTWWNANDDSTTATLTLTALRSMMSNCTKGGRAPTIILSRSEQYNRYWQLLAANQRFNVGPVGHDEQLGAAGFRNLLFDNVPWVIDDKVFDGPNTSNSAILMLEEDSWEMQVFYDTDFHITDWVMPHNQRVMSAHVLWYGNVINTRQKTQGKLTNISA